MVSCEKSVIPSENEKDSELSEQSIFWGVVGQLVDQDDITPDYKGKTFKPTIGTPDGGDESIRVVSVNSLKAAVSRFNDLTDAVITENTSSHTWQNNNVGSLTWNKGDGSTCWATVDVDIPSVPSLKKIIYRSAEQGDVNGHVGNGGSAYYRFGDVIKRVRQEDGITEYWICVRPAFDPQGKGDAHFVCVSPLPEEKVWPYNSTDPDQAHHPFVASNNMAYGLPENIGKSTEWAQDLVEMLYAIMYPTSWYSNIKAYSKSGTFGGPDGLPIFNDFHVKNIEYHNENFWRNVQARWKEKDLVQKIFGISYADMEAALATVPDQNANIGAGLHFLYYTSAWNIKYSNTPKLYQVHYSHGSSEVQKNMHKETKKTVSHQVVVPRTFDENDNNFPFNIRTETTQDRPYVVKEKFFGDTKPRWIIRYMTGEDLSVTGNFDNQQPIPGFTPANEVYRYYRDVMREKNLLDPPEITQSYNTIINDPAAQDRTSVFSGEGYYKFGDVLRDNDNNRWFVVRPAGGSREDNPFSEQEPFAELVSFEGISYTAGGVVATNLPDRNKLIRVLMPLWYLAQETYKKKNSDDAYITNIAANIKEHARVDLLHLMQTLYVERYGGNTPSVAEVCSFAYTDYSEGQPTKQHLLRFINQTKEPGNAFVTVLYNHYPVVSTRENVYPGITPAQFSDTPIYLQDVNDAEKVRQYAEDYMAKSPLSSANTVQRQFRQTTEARAANAIDYAYNITTWEAGTQPVGMWNEPVLLLRATALYDRGAVYATKSVDGIEFTMASKAMVSQEWQGQNPHTWFSAAMTYQIPEYRFVEGVNAGIPSWSSVWVNNE